MKGLKKTLSERKNIQKRKIIDDNNDSVTKLRKVENSITA